MKANKIHVETLKIPTEEEFKSRCKEFEEYEHREVIYKIVAPLIRQSWGNHKEVAEALTALLLTWNQNFYRYGVLNFDELVRVIDKTKDKLSNYQNRSIFDFKKDDEVVVEDLFGQFSEALKIETNKGQTRRSPVGTSKALHLLAPKFFPLWDRKIAIGYNCNYTYNPAMKYIKFMRKTKDCADKVKDYSFIKKQNKSIIKLIDQYNYVTITLGNKYEIFDA